MQIEFTIQMVTPSLNTWQRLHYRQRPKLREQFAWACRAERPRDYPSPPPAFAHVWITRHGRKLLDFDNCVGGIKCCVDSLKDAGFIADDDPAHLELHVAQQITREVPHMTIRLETP